MMEISYGAVLSGISILWLALRGLACRREKRPDLKREWELLPVYICIAVVVRFTFFPFGKVDGQIQPLIFDPARVWPPRINWVPLVHLFDYPLLREILINVIGNTAMFIPLGIVWPGAFRQLDTHGKVVAAGIGCSAVIEVLQLPFFDRVTDIDDLLLNTLGFLLGYGIRLLWKGK